MEGGEKNILSEEILTSFTYVLLIKLGGGIDIHCIHATYGRGWADRRLPMVGGGGVLAPPLENEKKRLYFINKIFAHPTFALDQRGRRGSSSNGLQISPLALLCARPASSLSLAVADVARRRRLEVGSAYMQHRRGWADRRVSMVGVREERGHCPLEIRKKDVVRGNFNLFHLCFTN